MLTQIPTHLIAGPLGAGKTTLIGHLLKIKPKGERWAVLINEFGQVGLDQALLAGAGDSVRISEIPGGCLCCVNGVPFQTGLARLLRQSQPDRLLIEPSGLGHPQALLAQLGKVPWQGVLALQPPIIVLDGEALASGQPIPPSISPLLADAGLLWITKDAALAEAARQRVSQQCPQGHLRWASAGLLRWSEVAGSDQLAGAASQDFLPKSAAPLEPLWSQADRPLCHIQDLTEGWSIGWRWHPSQRFDLGRLEAWLSAWPWQRAKLVVRGEQVWHSMNALNGQLAPWRVSEWRKDSRIELIFSGGQDQQALVQQLQQCLISPSATADLK